MGRIVVSNSIEIFDKTSHLYEQAGFKSQAVFNHSKVKIGLFAVSDRTCSYYSDADDFIIQVGTCIFKSDRRYIGIGERLFKSFDGSVNKLRNQVFGNYFLCIKKSNKLFIITDDYSVATVYYYHEGNKFCVSNALYPLACSTDLSVDKSSLLELCFQNSNLEGTTPFNEVKQLLGDQCILFTDSRLEVQSHPKAPLLVSDSGFEELVQELGKRMKKYFKLIAGRYPKIGINMTGGLDSRIILAGFLSAGARPVLLFGQGNSPLTNTKIEDLEICKKISERYNLDLQVMNWKSEEVTDQKLDQLLANYQDHFTLYGANENILEGYTEEVFKQLDFVEYGYFGEMIRNLPWVEAAKEDPMTSSYVIRKYLFIDATRFSSHGERFKSDIKEKIENIFFQLSGGKGEIAKDVFQQFHARYRYSADTIMNNFSNSFCDSVIMMGIPEIHEFILQIPFKIKQDASFQLRLIEQLYPDLLNVKFFSHAEEWVFDKTNFKLEPLKGIRKESLLRRVLRKNSTIKKAYQRFKVLFVPMNSKEKRELKSSLTLFREYVSKVKKLQHDLDLVLIDPEKFYGDIRSLIKYYQFLYMIGKSKKAKIGTHGNRVAR